jgi:hypothetical protein
MKKGKVPFRILKEIEKETNDEFKSYLMGKEIAKHCKKCRKENLKEKHIDLYIKDISEAKMKECDFCGKKGEWRNILRSTEISKKDGSDIILCNECLNNYASGDYDKIKLKEG